MVPLSLCHGVKCLPPCNIKSELLAALQLTNHHIIINSGCLSRRQEATTSARTRSGVCQLITAQRCFTQITQYSVARRSMRRPASSRSEASYSSCHQQLNREGGLKDESTAAVAAAPAVTIWSTSPQRFAAPHCAACLSHFVFENVPLSVSFCNFLFIGTKKAL